MNIYGEKINSSSIVGITDTKTCYARWTGIASKVFFDAQGGYVSMESMAVNYGGIYGVLPIEDTVLYAHWLAKKSTIYFFTSIGTLPYNTKILTCGDKYGDLPTPTFEGYTFLYWSRSDGEEVTSDSIVTAREYEYLYANWAAN